MSPNISFNQVHQVPHTRLFWKPLAIVHAQDLHSLVVLEVRKQLGCNEEILSCIVFAGDVDHTIVHDAFCTLIHSLQDSWPIFKEVIRYTYLIDLIDKRERCTGFFSQAHEIQDSSQRAFLKTDV